MDDCGYYGVEYVSRKTPSIPDFSWLLELEGIGRKANDERNMIERIILRLSIKYRQRVCKRH